MTKNYENTLQQAIDLVTEMKDYIEITRKTQRTPNDVAISEELSAMTVNITTLISWLFMLKARDNNEVSTDAVIEEGNLLIKDLKPIPDKLDINEYPQEYSELKEKLATLQKEIQDLYQTFIQQTLN